MKFIQRNNQDTVLFISGMFAGHWIWDRCYSQISASDQLMIDEPLCAIDYNVESLSDKISDHLKHISNPITIVGNSLGSLVGLGVAARIPEKVSQVLISGSGGFGEVNLNIQLSTSKANSIATDLMNLICYDKSQINKEDTLQVASSFKHNLRNIIKLIRDSHSVNGKNYLLDVSCPINAIWGKNDIITPYSTVKPVLESLDIPCHIISDCGHSPMYERPNEFSKWVNRCLEEQRVLRGEAHRHVA